MVALALLVVPRVDVDVEVPQRAVLPFHVAVEERVSSKRWPKMEREVGPEWELLDS